MKELKVKNLEAIQYNFALKIARVIRETSREKLFHQLSLESLEKKDGTGNFVGYTKFNSQSPKHIFEIIPCLKSTFNTRNVKIFSK